LPAIFFRRRGRLDPTVAAVPNEVRQFLIGHTIGGALCIVLLLGELLLRALLQ
jgi:hypothetical protein